MCNLVQVARKSKGPCRICNPYPGCANGCSTLANWRASKAKRKVFTILLDVAKNLDRAETLHPTPWPTPHHGLSVIRGELRELQAEVDAEKSDTANERMREEALDVATTAIRFLKDLY